MVKPTTLATLAVTLMMVALLLITGCTQAPQESNTQTPTKAVTGSSTPSVQNTPAQPQPSGTFGSPANITGHDVGNTTGMPAGNPPQGFAPNGTRPSGTPPGGIMPNGTGPQGNPPSGAPPQGSMMTPPGKTT